MSIYWTTLAGVPRVGLYAYWRRVEQRLMVEKVADADRSVTDVVQLLQHRVTLRFL